MSALQPLLDAVRERPGDDNALGVLQDFWEDRGDRRSQWVRVERALNPWIDQLSASLAPFANLPRPLLPSPNELWTLQLHTAFADLQATMDREVGDGRKVVSLIAAKVVRDLARADYQGTQAFDDAWHSIKALNQRMTSAPRGRQAHSQEDLLHCALSASHGNLHLADGIVELLGVVGPHGVIQVHPDAPNKLDHSFEALGRTGFSPTGRGPEALGRTGFSPTGRGPEALPPIITRHPLTQVGLVRVHAQSDDLAAQNVRLAESTLQAARGADKFGIVPGGGIAWQQLTEHRADSTSSSPTDSASKCLVDALCWPLQCQLRNVYYQRHGLDLLEAHARAASPWKDATLDQCHRSANLSYQAIIDELALSGADTASSHHFLPADASKSERFLTQDWPLYDAANVISKGMAELLTLLEAMAAG